MTVRGMLVFAGLMSVVLMGFFVPAWAGQATPVLPRAIPDARPLDYPEVLLAAGQHLASGDPKKALPELRLLFAHADFPGRPADEKFFVLFGLGVALSDDRSEDYGLAYLEAAEDLGSGLPGSLFWQFTATAAARVGKESTAVSALTAMATTYPEEMGTWSDALVRAILEDMDELSDQRAKGVLLESLWRMQYRFADTLESMDGYWLTLVGLYADIGRWDRAADVAKAIGNPSVLLSMYVDARFARLRPADPQAAIVAAMEQKVESARRLVEANPDKLQAVRGLAAALAYQNRPRDALAAVDRALAAIAARPGVRVFDDDASSLALLVYTRAQLLRWLGRSEEAIAAQREAVEVAASYDADELTQQAELARMMIWQGRPQEALDSIATMNLESIDGGAAAVADLRACAFAQQGNKPLAKAEVARLREAPAGRYYQLRTALLCIDDQDGLARLITATLDDPDSRADTLLDLQAYSGQEQQPAFWQLLKARFTQMTQRADVQAAIAKYGVMGSWPMADG